MKVSPQLTQTSFYSRTHKIDIYFKRFWIIKNQKEYDNMISNLCEFDAIVHPEFESFPCVFELKNDRNCPELKLINPLDMKKSIDENQKIINELNHDYESTFGTRLVT